MRRISAFLMAVAGIGLTAYTPASPMASMSKDIPTNMPATVPDDMSTRAPGHATTSDDGLKNGTYLIEGQAITLVNGVAEVELVPGSASKQVTRFFGNGVEIDLNLDGLMDSAFLLQQENGGSGTFYFVVAAIKTADGYLGTNAIFLGDRVAPQRTSIDPGNRSRFIVSYADRNAGEPMSSQPTRGVSKTFRLEAGSLVEVVASPAQTP